MGVLTHAGHSYSTNDKKEILSIANKEREDALASVKNMVNFNQTRQ